MSDEPEGQSVKRFSSALRGYSTSEVDAHLADLEAFIASLESQRDDLEREVARLRGELDATRAALPEIESLHHRLEEVREEYGLRVHALELFMAAATREVGARLAMGGPTQGSDVVDDEDGPEPGGGHDVTDEIPAVSTQTSEEVRGLWGDPGPDTEET